MSDLLTHLSQTRILTIDFEEEEDSTETHYEPSIPYTNSQHKN